MIRIAGYPLDLALTEEHDFESEVTEYPVESGADVSDNIRNKPLEITLEGIVSDTPIGAIALDATRRAESGTPLPSLDAYTRILAIRDARELVTIETSLGKFERMALTRLAVPRDRTTGKALKFTVSFRQVNVVQNRRTTVRVAVPNAGGKVNGGNRQPLALLGGTVRWVKSFSAAQRGSVSASMGSRILTTTAEERRTTGGKKDPFAVDVMDHYLIRGAGRVADGYVQHGNNGKDYYFAHVVGLDKYGQQYGVGGSVTKSEERIGDRDVTWSYSDNEWKDAKTGETVRKVPPGEDRWKGVQQRTRPTGKEPRAWDKPPWWQAEEE